MKKTKTKYLTDSSFLVGLTKSEDAHHEKCNSFWENECNKFVIPSTAYFEYQAAISRKDLTHEPERGIYLENSRIEKYNDITYKLIRKSAKNNLFQKFNILRGADLIYACIAWLENLTIVTTDRDFIKVKKDVAVYLIQ